jgi:branched-chain amino acid transport system permease protein
MSADENTPTLRSLAVLVVGGAILCGLALPKLLSVYYLQVADVTLINILLVLGLNFILGFGGQMSLAQCAFFGIGAYGFTLLQAAGMPVAIAAAGAIAIAAAVGMALGWPTLRLKGHYLALCTLAFALIVERLLVNWEGLTNGANGITAIPGIGLAGENDKMLWVLLAIVAAAYLLQVWIANGPFGLRIRALRDDPLAAQAVGVDISRLKIMLFVISAAYGGLAGICYVLLRGYISPDVFSWQSAFAYLAMAVVGGLGSSFGAVLGAILYTFVPELLRFMQEYYFAVFGVVVILVITFFPAGLSGLVLSLFRGLRRRAKPHARSEVTHHERAA